MAILIPPGFAEIAVELRATGDPDPWYVTWGVDCSASGGDIEQIGNTSITAFLSILEQISEDVTLTGAFVTLGQDGADNIRQFVPNGSLNHGGHQRQAPSELRGADPEEQRAGWPALPRTHLHPPAGRRDRG